MKYYGLWLRFQHRKSYDDTFVHSLKRQRGFTLVEVLASSVILIISVLGSIVAVNLIVQSVRGTGLRADQSRRIDRDIAEITRLSELYTSCVNPRGSIPATACTGDDVRVGNSFYYFPDPLNANFATNKATFFDACRTDTPGNHITAAFIQAVNNLDPPEGDVTRQPATRLEPAEGSNHLIEIRWTDPTRSNRELRAMRLYPVISSWCP